MYKYIYIHIPIYIYIYLYITIHLYVYCKSIRCCCVLRWIHLRIQCPRQPIRLRIDLDHVLACWDLFRVLALQNDVGVLVTRLPVVMQSPKTSSTRCNTHCNTLQRNHHSHHQCTATHCNAITKNVINTLQHTLQHTITQSPKPS